MKTLIGHVSPETAFVQPDYPYSFKLRCERRVWVETRAGMGMRVVTQTVNPKNGRVNAPKPGVYLSGLEDFASKAGEDPACKDAIDAYRRAYARREEKNG